MVLWVKGLRGRHRTRVQNLNMGKVLLCRHRTRVQRLNTQANRWEWWQTPEFCLVLGEKDRRLVGACYLASLDQSVSCRFVERPCLKT